MSVPACYLLSIFTASRLALFRHERAPSGRCLAFFTLIQCAALLVFDAHVVELALACGVLVAMNVLLWLRERRVKAVDATRLVSLILHALLFSVLFSPSLATPLRPLVSHALTHTAEYSTIVSLIVRLDVSAWALTLGLLLVANEANHLVRCLFRWGGLFPLPSATVSRDQPAAAPSDPEYSADSVRSATTGISAHEYNAGRLIGVLERTILYVLVLQGQYAAMAFILTAKTFARFKQMDERPFAEYVLVGTLLSALIAIAVAEAVRWVIR